MCSSGRMPHCIYISFSGAANEPCFSVRSSGLGASCCWYKTQTPHKVIFITGFLCRSEPFQCSTSTLSHVSWIARHLQASWDVLSHPSGSEESLHRNEDLEPCWMQPKQETWTWAVCKSMPPTWSQSSKEKESNVWTKADVLTEGCAKPTASDLATQWHALRKRSLAAAKLFIRSLLCIEQAGLNSDTWRQHLVCSLRCNVYLECFAFGFATVRFAGSGGGKWFPGKVQQGLMFL